MMIRQTPQWKVGPLNKLAERFLFGNENVRIVVFGVFVLQVLHEFPIFQS